MGLMAGGLGEPDGPPKGAEASLIVFRHVAGIDGEINSAAFAMDQIAVLVRLVGVFDDPFLPVVLPVLARPGCRQISRGSGCHGRVLLDGGNASLTNSFMGACAE